MAKYKKRKDGRYMTTVTVGYDENGNRIRVTAFGKTISELESMKAKIIADKSKGKVIKNKYVLFSEYSERWLNIKKNTASYTTYYMYESVIRLHTVNLSNIPMIEITKSDIEDCIGLLVKKPRTAQKLKITLNQIFNSAVEDNIIYSNPFTKSIDIPKYRASEKRPLTSEEDYLSEITTFTDREKAYILLIKYYGLRKEEALALTKNDFNFETNQITIKNAVIFIKNKPQFKETKSEASERKHFILKKDIDFFKNYINSLPTNFLFTCLKNNEWITEQSFKRLFESIKSKMTKKAIEVKCDPPLNDLSSHIFRHNYATILYHAGVQIKDAQYLLGHSSINVTLEIYTHLDKETQDNRNKIEAYLENNKRR